MSAEIRRDDKQKKDEIKTKPISTTVKKSGNSISGNVRIKNMYIRGNELIIELEGLEETSIREESKRIKTTIGFSRETYIMLKALSIATNEHMQDIIEKALHEYFEKEDVKRILITYFVSTGFRGFGNFTGPKFPQ